MSRNELLIIILLVVTIILLVAFIVIYLLTKNNHNDDVKLSINKEFLGFSKNLNDELNNFSNNTNQKINNLEAKITNNLIENYKITNESYNQINEKIVKIDEAQKSLKELSNDINSLQSILQDKKNRGTFGEIELYSILESVFGINDSLWKKQYKLSNDKAVDAAVFMANTEEIIPVDSKFPLENYRNMYDESLSKEDRIIARKSFKNDVLKHIDAISTKYILQGETIDLAYMFVPAEAIYSEIYANFPEVVDYSYKKKVYIVSPTTLLAYLTAIRSIYLGQKKNEKAMEIEKMLGELSVEFSRLKDRSESLQRDFEKIVPDFENMFITSNKIIKKFAKINTGELDDNNELD